MYTKIEITSSDSSIDPLSMTVTIRVSYPDDLAEMEEFISQCRIDFEKKFADKLKVYDAINARTSV